MHKKSTATFRQAKQENKKLALLTAYDYSTAKLFDESGVDGLLVGDSLGMVVLGYTDTLSVTMQDMIHHCKAVSRGAQQAMVIGDMPFMSYQTSIYDGIVNAGRLVQEGRVQAVKIEGAGKYLEHIAAITQAQIPVMGHLGLTPQSVYMLGGFRVQGKTIEIAQRLIRDAQNLEKAGVFSIVLEAIPYPLAQQITNSISIPTIGIGAGPYCDGQILVYQDMFNLYGQVSPKFVKVFADSGSTWEQGVKNYIDEVKHGHFPEIGKHTFDLN